MIYSKIIKRFFDIIISLSAIIILGLPLLIIAIAIKVDSKGPVLFKQSRIGKDEKLFVCNKFRTMRTDTPKDVPTHLLEHPDTYITKLGNFLRKSSLDELPQIFNIFKGDMSIIGPRPALYNQDDLVAERDKYGANAVRPGLTGLAQISGRDELEIPLKAKIDGEYVNNISFMSDLKIFFKTIHKVLKSDGVKEGKEQPEQLAEQIGEQPEIVVGEITHNKSLTSQDETLNAQDEVQNSQEKPLKEQDITLGED